MRDEQPRIAAAAGTSQMSPPLTNAIVEPSGEMPGSANEGRAAPSRGA